MSMFVKAVRSKVYLKIGISGPSGSGKTFSALQLAQGLAQGGPIAGVDTENGSMSLYAHLTNFDVMNLEPPFHPKKGVEAIKAMVSAGYKVGIIDSESHFWKFILEYKEGLDRQGGNSFTNWGKAKPLFDEFKHEMLQAPIHLICCMRSKDEYVLEKTSSGRDAPKKVGMGAILEPGAEYEFTTVFDIGMDHQASASKDRTSMFTNELFKITPDTGTRFVKWLESADVSSFQEPAKIAPATPLESPNVSQERPQAQGPSDKQRASDAGKWLKKLGITAEQIAHFMKACTEADLNWIVVTENARAKEISSSDGFADYVASVMPSEGEAA